MLIWKYLVNWIKKTGWCATPFKNDKLSGVFMLRDILCKRAPQHHNQYTLGCPLLRIHPLVILSFKITPLNSPRYISAQSYMPRTLLLSKEHFIPPKKKTISSNILAALLRRCSLLDHNPPCCGPVSWKQISQHPFTMVYWTTFVHTTYLYKCLLKGARTQFVYQNPLYYSFEEWKPSSLATECKVSSFN